MLKNYSSIIDHKVFCSHVINEFASVYGTDPSKVVYLDESDVDASIKDSWMKLQSRDWILGQTPKFTLELSNEFTWGKIVYFN